MAKKSGTDDNMNNTHKRKTVAILCSQIYGKMVREMEHGINQAALENDVKLIYFTSFSDDYSSERYKQYDLYDKGDIVSFRLPDLSTYDGVITLKISYPKIYLEEIGRIMRNVGDTPLVNVGSNEEGLFNGYCIVNDEVSSIKTIIEHLINVHHCKDIVHIAGRPDLDFVQDRVVGYKQTMDENGLEWDESKIYYGTLWRDTGEPAVEHYLRLYEEKYGKDGRKLPDAFVCANDYMALGLINALKKRGFVIPRDVIVTGFDNIDEARMGFPSLTTYSQPFERHGRTALETLLRIWKGEKLPDLIKVDGDLILSQSCGCEDTSIVRDNMTREIYSARFNKMGFLTQASTGMIIGMSAAETFDMCMEEVEKSLLGDTGFEDAILCLISDWDKKRCITTNGFNGRNEEVKIVAGIYKGKPVERCALPKGQLVPDYILEDPRPVYLFPIHHLQYYMGYLIVFPDILGVDQVYVKSWLVNLCSMLENWRIRRELKVAIDRLENLYSRDTLTGLYNRRGYEQYFKQYYKECYLNLSGLVVMEIDMDDMKYINDNFGHAEGDRSLCIISEAMKEAGKNSEIAIRTGGDEFVLLAKNYSEEDVENYIINFRRVVEEKCVKEEKPYRIYVSIGCCRRVPDEQGLNYLDTMSEEFLRVADAEMYKEKKQHKKKNRQ